MTIYGIGAHNCVSHWHTQLCEYEGVAKPARAIAPPCRGAGPTGLRGFTPTDTHIKYVFVDVRPLRCFAPPPLQGRALKKSLFSKIHYHNASKDASICCKCNVFVHYLTYYKRFYLRFVGSSFKYRTFSVPSYKAEEFILIHPRHYCGLWAFAEFILFFRITTFVGAHGKT